MSEQKTVAFYWDVGSTNTYFALHLIRPIVARHDAIIEYRPFNLGYVFRHHNYVLQEEPAAKLANRGRDLRRWAERYQLDFQMPSTFPIKTGFAHRGAFVARDLGAEDAYLDAIFGRYWEQNDASIATEDGIVAAAVDIGLDGEAFRAALRSDDVAHRERASTQEGLERGVFGAPTFIVDDEMYWGKDRMEFIEDALAGRTT